MMNLWPDEVVVMRIGSKSLHSRWIVDTQLLLNCAATADSVIVRHNVKVTGRRSAQRGGNQQRSCWRSG